MSGNYYSIDIWGLLIALVMVAVAAGISEAMRMGIGKTLLWSACRALLQLCAMGFIMEFVIKSNNPWLVLLLVPAGSISQELKTTALAVSLATLAMGNVAFLLYDRALHNLLQVYQLVWRPKLHKMLGKR